MAEPSPEELFKIWCFKRALAGLRRLDAKTLAWIATQLPHLGAKDAPAYPRSTPLDAIVAFLQAAAVHVTGRNMDYLSAPALFVFGALVGQNECEVIAKTEMQHLDATDALKVDAAVDAVKAEPTEGGDVVEQQPAPATGGSVPPSPRKLKLPSKARQLAAMAAQHFSEEPPKERSKALPPDVQYDIDTEIQQRERAARGSARPKENLQAALPAKRPPRVDVKGVPTEKKPKPATTRQPKPSVVREAAPDTEGDDDDDDVLVVSDTGAGVTLAQSKVTARPTRTAVVEESAAATSTNLAPKVARLVQILAVTTLDLLVEKLRLTQGVVATIPEVKAAVSQLVRDGIVVVDQGVVYPLC
jgi:hypothetical protein